MKISKIKKFLSNNLPTIKNISTNKSNINSTIKARKAKLILSSLFEGKESPLNMINIKKLKIFFDNAISLQKIANLEYENYTGELYRIEIIENDEIKQYTITSFFIKDNTKKDKILGLKFLQFSPIEKELDLEVNSKDNNKKLIFPDSKNSQIFVLDTILNQQHQKKYIFRIIENFNDKNLLVTCITDSGEIIHQLALNNTHNVSLFLIPETLFQKAFKQLPLIKMKKVEKNSFLLSYNPYYVDPPIVNKNHLSNEKII